MSNGRSNFFLNLKVSGDSSVSVFKIRRNEKKHNTKYQPVLPWSAFWPNWLEKLHDKSLKGGGFFMNVHFINAAPWHRDWEVFSGWPIFTQHAPILVVSPISFPPGKWNFRLTCINLYLIVVEHPCRRVTCLKVGFVLHRSILVGGFHNPFEKYAPQIGSFPQSSGWKFTKNVETTTQL